MLESIDPFAEARRLADTAEHEHIERIDDGAAAGTIAETAVIRTCAQLAAADWLDDDRRAFARHVCEAWLDGLHEAAHDTEETP